MTYRVELLVIGNEILSGQTLDTNSQWLAQRLLEVGLAVNHIQVVEDHVSAIASAIHNSLSRHTTLLITSGGLGPTFDDLTAQGLAKAARNKLELHPIALEMVNRRYQNLKAQNLVENAEITLSRKKMAQLPQGAEPLLNNIGTAPGIKMQIDTMILYSLPGVPQELQAMFLEAVIPQIVKFSKKTILQKIVQVPILDESHLAPLIDRLMDDEPGVYFKSLPRPYQSRQPLRVAITATGFNLKETKALLENAIKTLQEITKAHKQTKI
ncbi:MAG: competence/damage-inducible protein A [Candidatus Thorarchaeota archaeon]